MLLLLYKRYQLQYLVLLIVDVVLNGVLTQVVTRNYMQHHQHVRNANMWFVEKRKSEAILEAEEEKDAQNATKKILLLACAAKNVALDFEILPFVNWAQPWSLLMDNFNCLRYRIAAIMEAYRKVLFQPREICLMKQLSARKRRVPRQTNTFAPPAVVASNLLLISNGTSFRSIATCLTSETNANRVLNGKTIWRST